MQVQPLGVILQKNRKKLHFFTVFFKKSVDIGQKGRLD